MRSVIAHVARLLDQLVRYNLLQRCRAGRVALG